MMTLALTLLLAAPGQLRHGTWVYRIDGQPMADSGKLLAFAKRQSLTEVYLSLGAAPLGDQRTPALVRELKAAGLKVEALIEGRRSAQLAGQVVEYNRQQSPDARFDAVHCDDEPWVNSGESTAWVPVLLKTYRDIRKAIDGSGLSLVADISAAKFARLTAAQRAELLEASPRLVMMAYEASEERIHRQLERWLPKTLSGEVLVATRARDFSAEPSRHSPQRPCRNRAVLDGLDRRLRQHSSYAGWATFSFNETLEERRCPGDCCYAH